ncbi:MAG: hypothetical protein CM1200mP1_11610 [Candidatus Neomarinimicrobiota bacterium]|nr:MAG: hypothetical protein CM1200mP1_11610 [Candidatus Neomarinimicrobiota bacterium]
MEFKWLKLFYENHTFFFLGSVIKKVNSELMNSFNSRILKEIEVKQSHLCVGLDINPENF